MMTAYCLSPAGLLLAEVSRWESMGGGLRPKEGDNSAWEILAVIGGCAVLAAAVWWLLTRFTDIGRARPNSPRKLFAELCSAHGLDAANRRLLAKIARWQRLKHPARLFMEPERFETVNLSPQLAASREQVEAIRKQIFAPPPSGTE